MLTTPALLTGRWVLFLQKFSTNGFSASSQQTGHHKYLKVSLSDTATGMATQERMSWGQAACPRWACFQSTCLLVPGKARGFTV